MPAAFPTLVLASTLACQALAATGGPPEPPRAVASWIDRTAPKAIDGNFAIRSDLPEGRTRGIANAATSMRRDLAARLGGARSPNAVQLWLFASRSEFEGTLRSELGVDARGHDAVAAPRRGDRVVALCDATPNEQTVLTALARAIAEDHLTALAPNAPPWLVSGLPRWYAGVVDPLAGAGSGNPPQPLRSSLATAMRQGRAIGVIRLVGLDRQRWNANLAAGSGPLQDAESWALVATLLDGSRSDGAKSRELRGCFERWFADLQRGSDPVSAWQARFPPDATAALERAHDQLVARESTQLDAAIREARWLAEGWIDRLAKGEPAIDLSELRSHLLATGFAVDEECLGPSGRCPWHPEAGAEPAWRPTSGRATSPWLEVWGGVVAGRRLEVRWAEPVPGGRRYELRVLDA